MSVFDKAIKFLNELGISYIDLRTSDGVEFTFKTFDKVERIKQAMAQAGGEVTDEFFDDDDTLMWGVCFTPPAAVDNQE